MTNKYLYISERLSYPEIETIYRDKVLKQDFYNIEDAKEWASHVTRLHCSVDEGFVPHYLLRNRDMRILGVAIRSVRIS
ncbi:hypothetical protein D5R95_00145 [Methanosalsum natronophilum]|uniref:Uncharacterized protein n=1 Tax=Methanosalsum natronophilum TaxID=768733 RepID=A0A424Z4M0_9EURY|nr:MAG: hypothetical protein D5R95_00145 [Methanosalsum natronophilum]